MPKTDGQSKRTAADPNAEIYTPAFVAAFMLDFVEARLGRRLSFADRVLEPGAGEGAFILPLLERALSAPRLPRWDDPAIDRFLVACETNPASLRLLRERVAARLSAAGCPPARASALLDRWLRPGDFLRAPLDPDFDAVVGNPPYVRFDAIADEDAAFYRDRYPTFRGRCDLCVPFFERGLSLLAPGGVFSFICSNRFTKSEYGSRLRALVAARFHVAAYLNLEHAPVFGPDIAAYPAIFVIDRRRGEPTLAGSFDRADAVSLPRSLPPRLEGLAAFPAWYSNDEAWATTDPAAFARRKLLRSRLPSLEGSAPGTRFGIGVATGADDVFVLPSRRSDIEAAFQIPLVTGDDVRAGAGWTGRRLLSPLDPDGSGRLADLSSFPGLSAYLHAHEARLRRRYVAKANPQAWYRTLDVVHPALRRAPKLLLPDIQTGGIVGLDERGLWYPHHNLYWIVSDGWHLPVLAAILAGTFAEDQIRGESSELRGGSIRYQAKNLAGLRIPPANAVHADEATDLEAAWRRSDRAAIDRIVSEIVERCLSDHAGYEIVPEQAVLDLVGERGSRDRFAATRFRAPTPAASKRRRRAAAAKPTLKKAKKSHA